MRATATTGLLGIVSAILAALAVNHFGPDNINADTVLFSLISQQHLTLFYWGQARFANVVPLMVAWIKDPYWNLAATMFVFTIAFFALLIMIAFLSAKIVLKATSVADQSATAAVLILVTLLILTPAAVSQYAGNGNPYAMSYLLLGLATMVLMPQRSTGASIGLSLVLAAILVAIAIGLNPSALLAGLFGAMILFLVHESRAALTLGGATTVSFVAWSLCSAQVGSIDAHQTMTASFPRQAEILGALTSILSATNLEIAAGLGFALLTLGAVQTILLPSLQPAGAANRSLRTAIILLTLFALIFLLAFAGNAWVVANGSDFRYFFTIQMSAIVILSWFCYLALRRFLPPNAITVVCLAASVLLLAGAPKPLSNYDVLRAAENDTAYALQHKIRFIAGDYWRAWPIVFNMRAAGRRDVYGLAFRGEVNRHLIERELTTGDRVLCVNADPGLCSAQAERITGRRWWVSNGASSDPHTLLVPQAP
jgi:hypothetical protein